ncbi:hypothetical protein H2198_001410 [Neophaeococcomyces mojaviensis]|uniref:Uncharacterized protein n=1 Tax=Neophaeococcomyces mojaviensis TaxID=3383035 RepID=A0ACC3AGT3_9EURO|nr:hypothetical protein H2198_001410 [Knufia sp. JES_112]
MATTNGTSIIIRTKFGQGKHYTCKPNPITATTANDNSDSDEAQYGRFDGELISVIVLDGSKTINASSIIACVYYANGGQSVLNTSMLAMPANKSAKGFSHVNIAS